MTVDNLTYDDVLIWPTQMSDQSSRFDNEQCNPFILCPKRNREYLPIVSAPMDSIPSPEFIELAKDRVFAVFSHRFQSIAEQVEHIKLGAQAVIGLNTSAEDIKLLVDAGCTHLLLDVANGGNVHVISKLESLQYLREQGVYLWAGNVATNNVYSRVARYCDFIRVGIGGGSACTTRVNTGIGVGNVTAINMCHREEYYWLKGNGQYTNWGNDGWLYPPAKIVADGGIKTNGDICKALAAGSNLVMMGRQFAATKESAAPYQGLNSLYKVYRGMASKEVNEEHKAGDSKVSIEGAQGLIRVSGTLEHALDQMEGNLRSAMSYVNAHNLDEFRQKANLYTVSPSVTLENKAHGFS
jgi:IMP dehydrogenase